MPLPGALSRAEQARADALARDLVLSADQVASLVRRAVRFALFSPGTSIKPDAGLLNTVQSRFWSETEAQFFTEIGRGNTDRSRWLAHLRSVSLILFDEFAPLSADAGPHAARIVRAKQHLILSLAGYGAAGNALFKALGLPPVETKRKGKKQ